MTNLRRLNAADAVLIRGALFNAGVKARVKVCRFSLRVCFVGSWETVAAALNNEGVRFISGKRIDRTCFNNLNGELFVHAMEEAA